MGAFPIEKREDPPPSNKREGGAIKHTRGKKNSSKILAERSEK